MKQKDLKKCLLIILGDLNSLKESEEKYRQQYAEASHREKILVRRLASKEQEVREYAVSNSRN